MTQNSLLASARRFAKNVLRKSVRWGNLRSFEPKCSDFGYSRGQPIDRYYIEKFLEANSKDVRGRVLELLKDTYASRFGGAQVESLAIMNFKEGPPETTIVADLSNCPEIPDASFDTIILTQVMHCIPDLQATVRHLHRLLAPGGVVIATAPAVSTDVSPANGEYRDLWRFFPGSLRWLFEKEFIAGNVEVSWVGNLLTATAFLHGMSAEELERGELEHKDERYPILVMVRAVKKG